MGEAVILGVTLGWCAVIMFALGISQLKSKKPVGFYTGEKLPTEEQISDVAAWNRKHGRMWIGYGFCMIAAWVIAVLPLKDTVRMIGMAALLLIPLPLLILYHHKLKKRYYKKADE